MTIDNSVCVVDCFYAKRTFQKVLVVLVLLALVLAAAPLTLAGAGSDSVAAAVSDANSGSHDLAISGVDASPQTIALQVTDERGTAMSNASVQGFLVDPQGHSQSVFRGPTNSQGRFSVTNLSKARSVAKEWVDRQGPEAAAMSSPVIQVFLTQVKDGKVYFEMTSLPLRTVDILAGKSTSHSVKIDHSKCSIASASASKPAAPAGQLKNLPAPYPPTDYVGWDVIRTDGPYPSTPGKISTTWIEVKGTGNVYATLAESIFASSTTNFNVGYATGVNIISGSPAQNKDGSAIWTVTKTAAFGKNTGTLHAGDSANIWVKGQVMGQLFRLYIFPLYQDTYAYEVGLINIQVTGGKLTGDIATGTPDDLDKVKIDHDIGGVQIGGHKQKIFPGHYCFRITHLLF